MPWSTRLTFTNTSNRTTSTGVPLGASLSNPYTNYPGGPPFPYNGTYVTGGGLYGIAMDFEWAHAWQANVGIRRQVGPLSLGAAYVGTFIRNLPFARDVNYPVVTPTATAAGANVLIIEKNDWAGGLWIAAAGGNTAGGGTHVQKRHGVADTPEQCYQDEMFSCDYRGVPEIMRTIVDRTPETVLWLEKLGMEGVALVIESSPPSGCIGGSYRRPAPGVEFSPGRG